MVTVLPVGNWLGSPGSGAGSFGQVDEGGTLTFIGFVNPVLFMLNVIDWPGKVTPGQFPFVNVSVAMTVLGGLIGPPPSTFMSEALMFTMRLRSTTTGWKMGTLSHGSVWPDEVFLLIGAETERSFETARVAVAGPSITGQQLPLLHSGLATGQSELAPHPPEQPVRAGT